LKDLNKIQVVFLFRKKLPEFNSIESLFFGLIQELNKKIDTHHVNVPSYRSNIFGILNNIIFSSQIGKGIVHITGHINYLAIFSGKKTILTIHDVGSSNKMKWPSSLFFKFVWFKLPIYFSKRVTVISEFTRNEVLKISPKAANKIKVIPNPVNPEFNYSPYSFNQEKPKILFVGTKSNKNLERTIAALESLSCEFVILGELSQNHIFLLKKHSVFHLNKYDLSLTEVVKVYQDCDLLCFPSTYEGFGLPILEAQATGRPVITSNIGAMKEVAGESACLVDPFDGKSIREGVEKVILDKEYREVLIQNGLENVNKYKIETIAQQYYSLYQELESD
jgi:glycosyltransferase involved in cell wall biosynthesis